MYIETEKRLGLQNADTISDTIFSQFGLCVDVLEDGGELLEQHDVALRLHLAGHERLKIQTFESPANSFVRSTSPLRNVSVFDFCKYLGAKFKFEITLTGSSSPAARATNTSSSIVTETLGCRLLIY